MDIKRVPGTAIVIASLRPRADNSIVELWGSNNILHKLVVVRFPGALRELLPRPARSFCTGTLRAPEIRQQNPQQPYKKGKMLLSALRRAATPRRAFSTKLPRVPERRFDEVGYGGRSSNAGVKVAVFGASGFLGRYVCCELGT